MQKELNKTLNIRAAKLERPATFRLPGASGFNIAVQDSRREFHNIICSKNTQTVKKTDESKNQRTEWNEQDKLDKIRRNI